MQRIQRHLPVVGIDQMVPVRDHVVHRTAVRAERNAAVHAARRLILQLVLGQRLYELVPVLQALLGLFIAAVETLDLKESGVLYNYLFSSARALFGRDRGGGTLFSIDILPGRAISLWHTLAVAGDGVLPIVRP